MATFVQLLISGSSKASGASLVLSPSSKTVTVGNHIVVAFAGDDGGSGEGIIDNLGNSYGLVKEQLNAGNVKAQLWIAPVTTGGSLTTVTIAWTTNITAKAAVVAEFSGVGTLRLTDGQNGSGAIGVAISSKTFDAVGELWLGAVGVEDDVAPTMSGSTGGQTMESAGTAATSGQGSTSNIGVGLGYILVSAATGTGTLFGGLDGSQDSAGAGAIYNPVVATLPPPGGTPFGQSGQRQMTQLLVR